jgi:DNA polymerase-3 subunit epsilon
VNGAFGITSREADTALTSRARDFLTAGPSDSVSLVARVCQLPGVPAAVAEHLADTLLGGLPEFVRLPDRRWTVVPPTVVYPAGAPAPAIGERPLDALPDDPCAREPLAGMSFVVVDVETTGGRPNGGDRVTEFAAVVVRGGAIAERYETLLNPDRAIPPWISRLTNISWEMVRGAPRFSDVCDDVMRILGGHVFVAHNARFDWGFVSMEVARATGRELLGRQLCTVRLARRLLPQLRRRSLDYVADHYNVSIGARHRAMGDALATAHVLAGLLRDAESRGCTTWGDLERLLSTSTSTRRRRRPSALPAPVSRDTTA